MQFGRHNWLVARTKRHTYRPTIVQCAQKYEAQIKISANSNLLFLHTSDVLQLLYWRKIIDLMSRVCKFTKIVLKNFVRFWNIKYTYILNIRICLSFYFSRSVLGFWSCIKPHSNSILGPKKTVFHTVLILE